MGSPSRNVQYHPPRLSEDRLNLPQPHSPSLPTHCTAPGNRECAPRQLALDLGFTPVVPPLKTRTDPWEYDREMYKRRNEVERLFRRLKGYRRIFSRFEKLDVMFIGFIHFVLIFDALR